MLGRGLLLNLNYSFLGSIFLISSLGLNGISIEIRIIWYQSLGSKIRFTILLPFVSCDHPILFFFCVLYSLSLFCIVHQVKIVHQVQKRKKRETS
jgi:hypothetical protein